MKKITVDGIAYLYKHYDYEDTITVMNLDGEIIVEGLFDDDVEQFIFSVYCDKNHPGGNNSDIYFNYRNDIKYIVRFLIAQVEA